LRGCRDLSKELLAHRIHQLVPVYRHRILVSH
jgi:hypothetical protein